MSNAQLNWQAPGGFNFVTCSFDGKLLKAYVNAREVGSVVSPGSTLANTTLSWWAWSLLSHAAGHRHDARDPG